MTTAEQLTGVTDVREHEDMFRGEAMGYRITVDCFGGGPKLHVVEPDTHRTIITVALASRERVAEGVVAAAALLMGLVDGSQDMARDVAALCEGALP